MSKLFQPYTIGTRTLKNKLMMAPMCMYACHNQDGKISDWHTTHYESRAVGQTGTIILEATAVTPDGRISAEDLGIWSDEQIDGLRSLARAIQRHGSAAGIQLAHAGRKSKSGGNVLAPSALPFDDSYETPEALTTAGIEQVIQQFEAAAHRAQLAGFDIVQLHAAHGYLLHSFLSKATNLRNDEYGGDLRQRYNILHQIIERTKRQFDGVLMVRISANDYTDEGNSLEDYVQLVQWMKEDGVDLVDVSTGGLVPASIHVYPGYQVHYAETIQRETGMPTAAVGLLQHAALAEEILQNNRASLISVGRGLLDDPYLAKRMAEQLNDSVTPPVPYTRGW